MIEEKARELGRFIGQSNEYQAMKRANDSLAGDSEAVALLQEMETIRLDAQRTIQRGERPSDDMERRLEDLLGKVQVSSTYQRLVVAQENYDKLMMRVNDWILEGIKKGAASSIITLG